MFTIKPPSEFVRSPWKNGKGETIELAISDGGSLSDFDWRLSIATVAENGIFSDFSGLRRDLFLLTGNGIHLTHNRGTVTEKIDQLTSPLTYATFDGGSTTEGSLVDGVITDFNLMTRQGKYQVNIMAVTEQKTIALPSTGLCFIYSPNERAEVILSNGETVALPAEHLLNAQQGLSECQLTASSTIVIQLA